MAVKNIEHYQVVVVAEGKVAVVSYSDNKILVITNVTEAMRIADELDKRRMDEIT